MASRRHVGHPDQLTVIKRTYFWSPITDPFFVSLRNVRNPPTAAKEFEVGAVVTLSLQSDAVGVLPVELRSRNPGSTQFAGMNALLQQP